jgi:rare lipoprotein A
LGGNSLTTGEGILLKRIVTSLLIGLFLTGLAAAQSAGLRNFRQIGAATAELKTNRLAASHPSLPMGTQLKVTNMANGKEVIVTVTGRIPVSGTRIVDLSRSASARLLMNTSGTTLVTIETLYNTKAAPEPKTVLEEPKAQEEKPKKEEPATAPEP